MSGKAKGQAPLPPNQQKQPAQPTAAAAPALVNDEPASQDDLAAGLETGGLSGFKKPDDGITKAVEKVEGEIKIKMKEVTKEDAPEKLEIVGYRVNVVLGYMYFVKIKTKSGSFVQARILETPQGEISLQSVTETKTEEDERDYFKLPKRDHN